MAIAKIVDKLVTVLAYRYDSAALRKFDRSLENTKRKMNAMANMSFRMGVVGAGAMAVIGRAGIKTDEAMKILEARTGATEEQLRRFKMQAYEVGNALPLDTSDIIRGQVAFFQLGNTIEETFANIPAIARFAVAAEGVGVEQAAEFASVAKNNFKLTSEQVSVLLDQMLKAETVTAATAMSIGNSFQFSAAQAAALGMETNEYIAVLGTVAGAGRDVEAVSQGLGLFLTNLSRGMAGFGRGGPMVQKAFEGIGISIEEVSGQMKRGELGFSHLIKMIHEQTRGMEPEKLQAALAGLTGTSYSAAFGYLIENAGKLDEAFLEIDNSLGEAEKQSAIYMKGLSGGFKKLKASWDTLQNALTDEGVGGSLERTFRTISRIFDYFTEQEDGKFKRAGILQLVSGIMALMTSFLLLGVALKIGAYGIGLIQLSISAFVFVIPKALAALKWLRAAFWFTSTAARIMWLSLGGPVVWAIAGIAAIGIALYLFRDKLKGVWQWITDNWTMLLFPLLYPFAKLFEYLTGINLYESGARIIGTLVDGIKSRAGEIYDSIKDKFAKARNLLPFSDAREGPFSNLTQSGQAIVDTLREGIMQSRPLNVDLERMLTLPEGLGRMVDLPRLEFAGIPNMEDLARGFEPLPVAPPSQTAQNFNSGGRDGHNGAKVDVSIARIEVNAKDSDTASTIAADLANELTAQIRAAVEEADSKIRR